MPTKERPDCPGCKADREAYLKVMSVSHPAALAIVQASIGVFSARTSIPRKKYEGILTHLFEAWCDLKSEYPTSNEEYDAMWQLFQDDSNAVNEAARARHLHGVGVAHVH